MGGPSSRDLSGPNSCLNKVQIKEQGFSQSCTSDSLQTTITYESRKPVLTANVWTPKNQSGPWRCGANYTFGRLDSVNIQPGDGPFFTATLTYTQPLSTQYIETVDNDNDEATTNSLSIKMLSLPLEKAPRYSYTWNHILIGLSGYDATSAFWDANSGAITTGITRQTAIELYNNNSDCMRWINDVSQLPTQPEQKITTTPSETPGEDPVTTKASYKWYILFDKTKPGVEYFQIPTYEITESTKHKGRNNAAWCAAQRSGRLKFPTYGDFGLTKYHHPLEAVKPPSCFYWLCQGGDIHYDGKYWIAQCTYIWSPDPYGWDQDMYDVADGGYGDDFTRNSLWSFN